MSEPTFLSIKIDEVPDGGAAKLHIDDLKKIALFRDGDDFYAIDDRCPHASASLAEGDFDGTIVECPLHGYQVNVRTGQCLTSAFRKQKMYKVEIEGDEVRVLLG